jgi:hypothetical protein
MRPIRFQEVNAVYAEDQPEYLPLPVYKSANGIVTSCWELSLKERLLVLLLGKIYLSQMTFHQPLQPVLVDTRFERRLQ